MAVTTNHTHQKLATLLPNVSSGLQDLFSQQTQRFATRFGTSWRHKQKLIGWAKKFMELFILARAHRATDLQKKSLIAARKLAVEFIGAKNHHFVVACMDGRNMPAVMLSHVPHVGGFMRTPAGEIYGFFQGAVSEHILIDESSFPIKRIKRLLKTKGGDIIHYSLDSHVGCAARGGTEATTGVGADDGLRADIKRKLVIARGISELRSQLAKQQKEVAAIYPQFYSYDPHDGTLTMGLEMYVDHVTDAGFTKEVLDALQKQQKIVTTWQFLTDTKIVELLRKTVKHVNFRSQYESSMLSNWLGITELYDQGRGQVYQSILMRLGKIYQHGGWQIGNADDVFTHKISNLVLANKAKVMLKNLVTRWSIAQNHQGHGAWPFDKHVEQAIVLTEGGYAPFENLDVFSIFSQSDPAILMENVYLGVDLVRKFRQTGGIKDPLGILAGADFVTAPVVIMNKAILREMSTDGWKTIEKIDLSGFLRAIDWDKPAVSKYSPNDIKQLLRDAIGNRLGSVDSDCFLAGLYEVFSRMRTMMEDHRFHDMLLRGNIMVINLLSDHDRMPKLLIPILV